MGNQFDTSIGGSNRMFPSTLWSMVLHAGGEEKSARTKNLESLLEIYWKPVYCYMKAIRRKGSEDAKDLTQGFFTRLLEKGTLENLSPEKGTFRGFLKEAIRNYVIDAHRSESARHPRKGVFLAIEEFRDSDKSPQGGEDPQSIFDQEWDQAVLENALEELKHQMSNDETFAVFKLYCLPDNYKEGKRTYADVAQKMGLSEVAIRKRLARCRSSLREIMKSKIQDYAYDDQQAEEEYRRMVGE